MNWREAIDHLDYILSCPSKDPDFIELGNDFIESGIKYANIRAQWYLLDLEPQEVNNSERTGAHNAFIDSCNALSRIMAKLELDTSWRMDLGDDRRDIGDFACYLHALVAIKSR